MNRLRVIAAVSGPYDALAGVAMMLARPLLAQIFAASDGALALLTLWALLTAPAAGSTSRSARRPQ